MADKDNNQKPITSLIDEEESMNFYLAQALKEEIQQAREKQESRNLPNSRSEGSLNLNYLNQLPAYLTDFKIPQIAVEGNNSNPV